MSDTNSEQWLRQFLLGVVAAIFIGSIFELILLEHYEEVLQFIPFVISGLGAITVAMVWRSPGKNTIRIFRWMMGIAMLTSLVGVYFHFTSNFDFVREMNPSFTIWESIWPAMKGAHPLLAPGILFLAGILGFAATYQHPKMKEGSSN